MGRDFRWYWTAPRYREALSGRVANDRVEVGGGSIDAPAAPLVEAGCVAETRWRRGKLMAVTSIDALIAAGRTEELRRCAEEGSQGAWLRLSAGADPATVYLMVLAFGDSQAARARLRAAEAGSVADLCQTAKAWKHLLGEAGEAERCLRAAEEKSASAGDLVACAEAWMSVGANAEMRRCLGAAEGRAAGLDDMLAVGLAWARLADDGIGFQRGIERALVKNDDTATLIAIARAWRSVGDDAAARKTMQEAESRASSGADQAACAGGELEIFGDEAAFRRCLDQATQVGGWRWVAETWHHAGDEAAARATLEEADGRADTATLVGCAEAWKNLLGDGERGRRTLGTAESRATGTREWAACAAAWKRIYADENETKRCLGEMEKHAKETADWAQIATYTADVDEERAKKCLERGQEAARSSADFVVLARGWQKLQPSEVTRCLEEADKRAEDVAALCQAATAWQELLSDGKRARAVLTRAEAGAADQGGWTTIAHAWARIVGDPEAARRCMAEAERRVTEAVHWTALGNAFERILGDDAESRRCRVKAMELLAGDDIGECASGWRRILDDDEARRRLQAREADATGVEAWEKLAAAWKNVFADDASVQRCSEWIERWRRVQVALDANDWTSYARTWREILPDEAEARGRLKSVEERANSVSDWSAFARAWKRVFEDDAEARRCMEAAESKARFKSDWKLCGEAWRDLGQYGEAQRCADHR
jgi:hypothetical protein